MLSPTFPPSEKQDWLVRFTKEIKDLDVSSISQHSPSEEINIFPYFTTGETPPHNLSALLPPKTESGWEHTFEVTAKTSNSEILAALNFGANSLYVSEISANLPAQLQGVQLSNIRSHFFVKNEQELEILHSFTSGNIDGTVAVSNSLLVGKLKQIFPKQATIEIDTTSFHQSGSNILLEMALALALANQYAVNDIGFRFRFAIGTDYLFEIARLRAFRILWANLAQLKALHPMCLIQAETSRRELSPIDTDTNLLRHTTMAMAAISGTADSLIVRAHTLENSDDANRLALNIHNLLADESEFEALSDPCYGSYYIEALTEALIDKAWEKFLWIEENGGYSGIETSGWLAAELNRIDALRKADLTSGKVVKVGLNKYTQKV